MTNKFSVTPTYYLFRFAQNTGIVVLAATNLEEKLDKALVRPGRFDKIIRLRLPNLEARKEIIEAYLKGRAADGMNAAFTLLIIVRIRCGY